MTQIVGITEGTYTNSLTTMDGWINFLKNI